METTISEGLGSIGLRVIRSESLWWWCKEPSIGASLDMEFDL